MTWCKTEFGGWSDTSQAVSLEQQVAWELEVYLRSCYLYYHSDYEPILSDAVHDMGERFLERNWELLPQWVKDQTPDKQLKPHAHHLPIPEDVKERAIVWRNNIPHGE